jgi:hypothetical protein
LIAGSHLDETRVHLHPTPSVDLVAISVTDKLTDPQGHTDSTTYTTSYWVSFSDIQKFDTTITNEVIAQGYPLGIRSLKTNYPIAKIGYLASTPGEEVSIPIKVKSRANVATDVKIDGKFLVVDGPITNGNSGGPVVLVGGGRMRLVEVGNSGKYQRF